MSFDQAPLLSSDGVGGGSTPWRAVQVAAWEALNKAPGEVDAPTPADDVILP